MNSIQFLFSELDQIILDGMICDVTEVKQSTVGWGQRKWQQA